VRRGSYHEAQCDRAPPSSIIHQFITTFAATTSAHIIGQLMMLRLPRAYLSTPWRASWSGSLGASWYSCSDSCFVISSFRSSVSHTRVWHPIVARSNPWSRCGKGWIISSCIHDVDRSGDDDVFPTVKISNPLISAHSYCNTRLDDKSSL